jgi:hypothetical protein
VRYLYTDEVSDHPRINFCIYVHTVDIFRIREMNTKQECHLLRKGLSRDTECSKMRSVEEVVREKDERRSYAGALLHTVLKSYLGLFL